MADSSAEMTLAPRNWLLARLPDGIVETLTIEQRQAIHDALLSGGASRQPVNIRLSLPFLKWRFFITVISGGERRSRSRLADERAHHPLRTIGNLFFVFGLACLFYLAALFAFALQSAIIEF
ncbi:MAG: hypothetical protein MI741_03970 [Rhodospirillales bacterium]|nr:hypothetical protein [Rhodospirillales bacterium]